jgi:hypothetical protein
MDLNAKQKADTEDGINEHSDIYWMLKLSCLYTGIIRTLEWKNHITLEEATLKVIDSNTLHGQWNPTERIISISRKLMCGYEWGAVEHVMKHEIAHQIVSEHFKARVADVSHGEFFKTACDILDIDSSRTTPTEILMGYKGTIENPIFERIRKLLAKGYDEAIDEKEAKLFLCKAQEIMMRHNIGLHNITGRSEPYVYRILGGMKKVLPSYMCTLGRLLKNYYNIEYIIMTTYYPKRVYIEIFGEPSNLDVAEYIGKSLLVQAHRLFEEYKVTHPGNQYERNSRAAFITGVIEGYSSTLHKDETEVKEKIDIEDSNAIMTLNQSKELRRDAFERQYNPRKRHGSYGASGKGYGAGCAAGAKIKLSKGVGCGAKSSGKLIGA